MRLTGWLRRLLGGGEHAFNPVVKFKGRLTSRLIRADGTEEVFVRDNLIVSVGYDLLADCIGKASGRPSVVGYLAVGTGTGAAASGNTALGTEVLRKAVTYAHTVGTTYFTFSAQFNPGEATGVLTECGLFNASSGGIMLDRVVFGAVTKNAIDTLVETFSFSMA